jgi:hypothetical protein
MELKRYDVPSTCRHSWSEPSIQKKLKESLCGSAGTVGDSTDPGKVEQIFCQHRKRITGRTAAKPAFACRTWRPALMSGSNCPFSG